MRAPARIDGQLVEGEPGGLVYPQISDEMLNAFEADCRLGYVAIRSIGQMIARIRESEKDRDALYEALVMVRDADNDCRLDGERTIPQAARAKIDTAIGQVER